ncbi:MAG: BatA domain-containing protein [Chitinispirillaceae bacterium]|nr:BatA domain-containing protein [Chitinispirillaceae bacterium]
MLKTFGFLEPAFLWALTFLGLVLLVHFLKRPRTLRLMFSTLRFFDESAVAANRSNRLRRLLLLFVRLALATLLVLLFARPFIKNDPLRVIGDPQYEVFIWIDRTPSMEYRENDLSIGERARLLVDSLAEIRSAAGMFLYDHDRREFVDLEQARELSFSIRHAPAAAPLQQACERAVGSSKRPAFLIFSDFQSATTGVLVEIMSSEAMKKVPVIGTALTPKKPWNAAVAGVSGTSDRETVIAARLVTSGKRGFSGSCIATIGTIRMPPFPCTLSSGIDTTVTMTAHRPGEAGWGSVTLRGDDPFAFDNTGHFVFGRSEGFSVLIVGDEAENYPIAAALRASEERRKRAIAVRAPDAVISGACDSADLIIVNGYRNVARPLEMLQNYRGSKKQAFIVASASSDSAPHAEAHLLHRLSIDAVPKKTDPPLNVALPDTISGLWRGFPSMRVAEARVYEYADGLKGTPLLLLTNKKPLVVATSDAFGRPWIVAATPLGVTSANNLCETGFYVPFIDRLVRSARSALEGRNEAWTAGAAIKNPWYNSRVPARLLGTDNTLILQLQQQPSFVVELPGVYTVVPPAGTPYLQVVVPDTLESRLDYRLPAADRWTVVSPQELFASMEGRGRSLWRLAPLLLLGLLLFSELLLRRGKQR